MKKKSIFENLVGKNFEIFCERCNLQAISKNEKKISNLTPVVADNLWTRTVFAPSVALRLN
jgi:hypothetical protein